MTKADEKKLLGMKDKFIVMRGDGTVNRDFFKGKAAGVAFAVRFLVDAEYTGEEEDD